MLDIKGGLEVTQKNRLQVNGRMLQSLSLLQTPGIELEQQLREEVCRNPFLEEELSEPTERTIDSAWRSRRRRGDELPGWLVGGAWTESVPAEPATVAQRLLRQARLYLTTEHQARQAEYLLGCLDDKGYLALAPKQIAIETGWSAREVEAVRQRILYLDPPGFCALSLKECLMVQLQALGETDTLAFELVKTALPDLAARRYIALADRLQVSKQRIVAAAARIRKLWPCPTRLIEAGETYPIYPDLIVERIDGQLVVQLSHCRSPQLRFARPSAALLKETDREVVRFVAANVARARWLLGSLGARRRTLLAVMRLIVEEQTEFFVNGIEALKPMGYRYLADRLGYHESTVARAVQEKYVQTPQGTFGLRFFFTKALPGLSGETWTAHQVRQRMRELIRQEDDRRPLSDDNLTRILRGEGIDLSRRTVAKYRDRMRLPRAAYRRAP